jgi:hypothetical protein
VTPKEKREKLFGNRRPLFRPLQVLEGSRYHRDIALLWVSYSRRPFFWFPKNLDQQSFARVIEEMTKAKAVFICEDFNAQYKNVGPIGFLTIDSDGWTILPHAEFFPWATSRNKLRAAVSFFQWVRHQNIGVCLVHSMRDSKSLFDKCSEYGVLHYVGRIVNGDPRGDDFLFSVRGTKCPDPAPIR